MAKHDELFLLGALVAAAAMSGCREQVFEPVRDGLVATAALDGEVRVTTKADLLFVIDDTPSMRNEQEKLAAGFPKLLEAIEKLDPPVDYRVAVMTTSVVERFGPCDSANVNAPSACSAAFGGTGFSCEANACVRHFPGEAGKLVSSNGNPTVLERSKLSQAELARLFAENVNVGLGGSRHEQPLRALSMAFTNGALDGFWRPDARLVVLIASDEDDCSDSTDKFVALEQSGTKFIDHCLAEAKNDTGRLDDVNAWVRQLQNLPVAGGKTREVAIGAIVGLAAGTGEPGLCTDEACASECRGPDKHAQCETDCTGSTRKDICITECVEQCATFCGAQAPGIRTSRAVRAMSGPVASICESDFGPALGNLARIIGIPEAIDLPSKPNDGRTFFFRIHRGTQTIDCRDGADYDLVTDATPSPQMSIRQDAACRLFPGDKWSIRYVAK